MLHIPPDYEPDKPKFPTVEPATLDQAAALAKARKRRKKMKDLPNHATLRDS